MLAMTLVVLFIIISIITGFILTYFLSARYSIFERVAYGTVIGLGLHTWIVYLFSLLWGLSGKSIYISIALSVLLPNLVFGKKNWTASYHPKFKKFLCHEIGRRNWRKWQEVISKTPPNPWVLV